MSSYKKPTDYFDEELARCLADKIIDVYPDFDGDLFVSSIGSRLKNRALKQRVELMADELYSHLPDHFPDAVHIILQILGPENREETGMFTEFYWLMPAAKFVEKYGLSHFDLSIEAIGEITKRNTGEYAIRPFIKTYPDRTVAAMKTWARSRNFHLRRLASEGLRPKLPWAHKLTLFIENPEPVFEILEILKSDPIRFVQKSVANHLADYLKVNPQAVIPLLESWDQSDNKQTQWIVNYARRNQ